MRLSSIHIEKFRSIDDCILNVNSLCALVGENNTGKSSLLRALNSFFNYSEEKNNFINKNHQYSPKSLARIGLTFTDIEDISDYNKYIENGKMTIRMEYSFSTDKVKYHYKSGRKYIDLEKDFIFKEYPAACCGDGQETVLRKAAYSACND